MQYGFHDSCPAQESDLEIHPVLWFELLTVFSERNYLFICGAAE
jgi:hypothetical protein